MAIENSGGIRYSTAVSFSQRFSSYNHILRARSSVGRAVLLQSKGRRFDSSRVHY